MKTLALDLLRKKNIDGEFKIGFHKYFASSISHLHMHAFEMPFRTWKIKWMKYNSFFFIDIDTFIERLELNAKNSTF
jgi:hypothetical protein